MEKEIIDFTTWYSGMDREKVIRAYQRYLRETIISDASKETRSVSDNKQTEKKCHCTSLGLCPAIIPHEGCEKDCVWSW